MKTIDAHCHLDQIRDATGAVERAVRFKAETGLNALMHWFTASRKLIAICAREGIFVSVGPSVLFHSRTRETAAAIPDHLLLVETDSPVPYEGRPAEPSWAADVTIEMSKTYSITPDALGRILQRNLERFLNNRS